MLIVLAALTGLLGVGLSAAAAHVPGGAQLETASRFLLLHAPVLLVIVALAAAGVVHPGFARIAGWVMLLGLALFCGDLAMRALRETALFPMAAPAGGILIMGGWLLVAVAALANRF